MKKQRIVLASVLKPVDDVRMFEKIGKSLSAITGHDVFIIGYPSKAPVADLKITFIPLPAFDRLSLKRMWMPMLILKKVYKLKPEIVIVNTHELLIVAMLIRIFFGCRIVYDVQENYWRNILYTDAFLAPIRPLIAVWVRAKETVLSPFIDLFFLAEKGFEKEMKFFGERYVILENKSLLPPAFVRLKSERTIQLLFSGTISESTGVFQAIGLASSLHQLDPSVRLNIIGYCSRPSTLLKVKQSVAGKPFITITGGDQLVPHSQIISSIATADFGILYYPASQHTENKVPTKLYEYLSARLPILIQNHRPWTELCLPCHAAISIDFTLPFDAPALLKQMEQADFYTSAPKDVDWLSEEKKLLASIKNISY